MQLSVIICCHNPRMDYLARVLGALKAQTLSTDNWELLVVDNASKDPVSASHDISWHPKAHHVREMNLGLTHARLRGIAESRGDLLIFVDDDNVLAENYLDIANQIATDWPCLGAWGGQHFPEFEGGFPVEKWKVDQWTNTFSRDLWSNNYDPRVTPFGAGLCVRKKVAEQYADLARSHPLRRSLDRKGDNLNSSGDIDMAFVACDLGMGLGRFVNLKLDHLIPKGRTNDEYLLRLSEESGYSQVILDALRGIKTSRPRRIDRIANFLKRLFLDPMERRLARASEAGRTRAINELNACAGQISK